MKRHISNILVADLERSRDFYKPLLDLKVQFESDWYIQLGGPAGSGFELGLHRRDHELIPPQFQAAPAGMYMTFVVDDVDAKHAFAQAEGLEIVQAPQDTAYGLRRMLLSDPDGLLIDISALIKDFK